MSLPTTKSTLVLEKDGANVLTDYCETDARTAMARGLAEYLADKYIVMPGGRELRFVKSFESWAVVESVADFPSVVVYAEQSGLYGGSAPAPTTPSVTPLDPDEFERSLSGKALLSSTDLVQTYIVDVWANDPKARMGLAHLLEGVLMPVDWMGGFMLDLPHYFNQRAIFGVPTSIDYDDGDLQAARRYYRALLRITGTVVVSQVREYPRMQPKVRYEIDGLPDP